MIATDPRSRSLTTPKNPFTRPVRPTDPFGVSSGGYQPIGPRLAALSPPVSAPSQPWQQAQPWQQGTGLLDHPAVQPPAPAVVHHDAYGNPISEDEFRRSVSGYVFRPDQIAVRNQLGPEARAAFDSAVIEAMRAEHSTSAARNAALGTLGDSRTRLQGELDRYRSDPRAAYIGGEFERMSRPDYEAIGQAQQAAGRLTIGQAYAHAMDEAGRSAAASGTYASPTTGSREAYLSSLAAGQTAGFNANVEGQNAAARNEALRNLSAFNETRDRYGLALDDAISRMDSELARAQADVNYVPSDVTPYLQLSQAEQHYQENKDFDMKALDAAIQSGQFDPSNPLDWANLATSFRGNGLFKLFGG